MFVFKYLIILSLGFIPPFPSEIFLNTLFKNRFFSCIYLKFYGHESFCVLYFVSAQSESFIHVVCKFLLWHLHQDSNTLGVTATLNCGRTAREQFKLFLLKYSKSFIHSWSIFMFISQLGEIPRKVSGVNLDSTLRHNVGLRLQFSYKNVFSSCFLIKTRKESFLVHICDSRQSVSSSFTKAATLLCPGYTEI